jgi:hypothetical protein
MSKSKGISKHPLFKLGKIEAKRDSRNLKFAAILRVPAKLPAEYDFDVANTGIPTPMFANDKLGDCVIAGRAHQTLRFERREQGKTLKITDAQVTKEYLKQTGGGDTGLVVLESLKLWRSRGWHVADGNYRIEAFTELNRATRNEIKQAIYLDVGVGIGLALPISARAQFDAGKPWDTVSGPNGKVDSWGGHYVFCSGYTKRGPVCVTWGRKQQLTWRFFAKYCDEAYAIFDKLNQKKSKKALDTRAVKAFLAKL